MKKIITGIIIFIVLIAEASLVNAYDGIYIPLPLDEVSKWRKFTSINGRNCFVNFTNCFL